MIRLAGEGTRELVRSMIEQAKAEAGRLGSDSFQSEVVQVDSQLVQVRVDLRMGRGGVKVPFATLWLNGHRRGFNHVCGEIG
jgi:hypothetical protein